MREYTSTQVWCTQFCVLLVLLIHLLCSDATLVTCGNGRIDALEICDDGNVINNDGCSSLCSLEPGYMCHSSVRHHDNPLRRGYMVQWSGNTTSRVLTQLTTPESCAGDAICPYDIWQAHLWNSLYTPNTGSNQAIIVPEQGYYCRRFCEDTFPAPFGYEFKDGCNPTPISQCARGLSSCDSNAYCLEEQGVIGHTCRCDADFFVSGASGTNCDRSGIELALNLTAESRDKSEADLRLSISAARDVLIHHLFMLGYIKNTSSTPTLVLEGVADYPVEMVDTATSQGNSIWRIILRIPRDHASVPMFETGALFREYDVLSAIFMSTEFRIQEAYRCGNDRERTCGHDLDCIGAEGDHVKCLRVADAVVRFRSTGGTTSPLSVKASGFGSSIVSVDYDASYSAFRVRIRYAQTLMTCMQNRLLYM